MPHLTLVCNRDDMAISDGSKTPGGAEHNNVCVDDNDEKTNIGIFSMDGTTFVHFDA